ncbi:MAG: hypothetical protein LBP67_04010 [Bacteroidales bacterium]|jgi:hypothetical protein|nr:hypothetical protein [Bacteroidales bacterium]
MAVSHVIREKYYPKDREAPNKFNASMIKKSKLAFRLGSDLKGMFSTLKFERMK